MLKYCTAGLLLGPNRRGSAPRRRRPPRPRESRSFIVFVGGAAVGREQVRVSRAGDGWIITSTGQSGAPVQPDHRSLRARSTRPTGSRSSFSIDDDAGQPTGLSSRRRSASRRPINEITQNGVTNIEDRSDLRAHDRAAEQLLRRDTRRSPRGCPPRRREPISRSTSRRRGKSSVDGQRRDARGDPDARRPRRDPTATTCRSRTRAARSTRKVTIDDRLALRAARDPGAEPARRPVRSRHGRDAARSRCATRRTPTSRFRPSGFNLARHAHDAARRSRASCGIRRSSWWREPATIGRDENVARHPDLRAARRLARRARASSSCATTSAASARAAAAASASRSRTTPTICSRGGQVAGEAPGRRPEADHGRRPQRGRTRSRCSPRRRREQDRVGSCSSRRPARTGADLVLEQQTHVLDVLKAPEDERRAKIDLQKKIHTAVITETGWEGIPPATPGAGRVDVVPQPSAVRPGEGHAEGASSRSSSCRETSTRRCRPHHAETPRGSSRGRARRRPPSRCVHLPAINHLLVPAVTGEVSEYAGLKDKTVTPAVAKAIADWLSK